MPPLPYLSAAASVAAGLSYTRYIIRSGPKRFPQSQSSDHISSGHSFRLLSPLLTVSQAAKTPSLTHIYTRTQNQQDSVSPAPSTEHSDQAWC